MTEELRNLIKRRGQSKAHLTRFASFVENLPNVLDEAKSIELRTRLQKVQSVYTEFESFQSEIEILNNDESDGDITERTERESFENQYFKFCAIATSKLTIPSNLPQQTSHDINIKLPQISIPEFNGQYEKWLQFYDCFVSLIHNNTALTKIQKFYYLQTALKGEALAVIRALEVSDANYPVAWQLLTDRYQNKRIIIHSHVRGLFDLQSVAKESHHNLRKLLDSFVTHFRCLKNLGQPVEHWDTLLIHLISNKLDSTTKKDWEKSVKSESPTTEEFIKFLTDKCILLETLENKHVSVMSSNIKPVIKGEKSFSHVAQNSSCPLCKGSHPLFYCKKFMSLSAKNRYTEVRNLGLCTNCLRSNHSSSECTAYSCKKCHKKHNTLLHFDSNNHVSKQPSQDTVSCIEVTQSQTHDNSEPSVSTHCLNTQNPLILLQTAVVFIINSQGVKIKCRALLDSGSQANFITKNLYKKLNIVGKPVDMSIAGINNANLRVSNRIEAIVQSSCNSYKVNLPFLIIDTITGNIPSRSFDSSIINIPENITLADPDFNKSNQVDILLGAGIFFDLLCIGQIKIDKNQLILQKSKFGWIIAGPLTNFSGHCQISCLSLTQSNSNIQSMLEKFWSLEECPQKSFRSQEENECEQNFIENVKRDSNNHFIVKLPLRENVTELDDSLSTAKKRLFSVERKLDRNPEIKQQYHTFMNEYLELGHMSQINLESDHKSIKYYIPHNYVLKDSSLTTKLRVVFDASCKSVSGISLNDVLKIGPVIQDDLFSILLRFRKHNYVITGDITKMYRQVYIHEDHRDLQRVVWRFDRNSEVQHFRLNTVTYGTASASFLATRALQQSTIGFENLYPEACRAIMSDFYVDDLISGSHDLRSTIQLKTDISHILNNSGFPLRKWNSNNKQVLADNLNHENSISEHYLIESKEAKILGIAWNSEHDILRYDVTADFATNQKITKRQILSITSQIFDPLGLIGAVTIKAKLILQQLWQLKLNWDDAVPDELQAKWLSFQKQIMELNQLQIPRQVLIFNAVKYQIHGFSDASQYAYGAVIYLRSVNEQGIVSVNLLCAKSRVAPLKTITLPKLELCGALLLAQLVKKVLLSYPTNNVDVHYWTDSTICLAWISSEPHTLKTFVANRVADIQRVSDTSQWRHVPTSVNPADVISRGICPSKLINSSLWWNGPSFLNLESENWPNNFDTNFIEIPERKNTCVTLKCSFDVSIFDKFSSLRKLQRVMSYCLRFINNIKRRESKVSGEITLSESSNSLIVLSKIVQQSSFPNEIYSLKKTGSVSNTSKLASLAPFIDEQGVIRVGGRLKNSELSFNQIHPIVLPSKHNFTKLIINHEHLKNLHAGAQFILANIRRQFWPLNGRATVRSVLRRCLVCFRAKPSNTVPLMGDLPQARVVPARPFQNCGIDYCGPITIKDGKLRNRAFVKAYLCIFVCFATKATHIEVVTDLTSGGFLDALKRFVSRRGLCQHIYSDNGTNFVGAKNQLDKISIQSISQQQNFKTFINDNHITWHFIPPRSPHFGGLWEAAVKSAKAHLLKVIGGGTLTYESLCTIVVQIEAILNSRPITPISQDPNDLLPLTPGHFLIGDKLNALPQLDTQQLPLNRVSHYLTLQKMVQHFWSRWSSEYLNQLQQRSKWRGHNSNSPVVGSLVLIKEENTAPLQWKLGRVLHLHPGKDQVVRVVSVKTSSGVIRRAVHKLCLLPIEI